MTVKNTLHSKPLRKIKFAVMDLETTGFGKNHRTIEIAAIKLINGKIIDRFHSLIHTESVPYQATLIHGIDAPMLSDAPSLHMVRPKFCKFIKGCVLVGHNIASFDNRFLCKDFKISNSCFVDTLKLSRMLFPNEGNHKLRILAARLGIRNKKFHRALNDAKITVRVFTKLLSKGKFRFLRDIL